MATSTSFDYRKLNSIDNRTKDSVFGYIRLMERELSFDNIPDLISFLILLYYYHNEYFAKYGEQVKVSNDNMIITNLIQYPRCTVYGNTWIDTNIPQIAIWKLKISVRDRDFGITMSSKDTRLNHVNPYFPNDNPWYALSPNWNEAHDDPYLFIEPWWDWRHSCSFSVILDTKNRTISVRKDEDSELLMIYQGIDIGEGIKYKLGVILYSKGDNATLIDFDLRLQDK